MKQALPVCSGNYLQDERSLINDLATDPGFPFRYIDRIIVKFINQLTQHSIPNNTKLIYKKFNQFLYFLKELKKL